MVGRESNAKCKPKNAKGQFKIEKNIAFSY